jgi:DNA (cytosine-5)-methyltransferase 1
VRYLSLCSGIEAATQAWHPLGWRPVAFSEIDPFPCAVLAHHYPHVPNLGDMTRFQEWPDADVDVLVGGTPCQSFSVAGLRKGLADPRGNLMLTYLAIADRYRPRWIVWENVPGVLSSGGGRDFGAFLGGLGKLGYGFAYRVLDAQYVRTCGKPFAVPQRRRRVFVVGYLGDWRRAAAVLVDPEGLRGVPPPRRKAGQIAAPTFGARPAGGGGHGTDFDCDGGLIPYGPDVSPALKARDSKGPSSDGDGDGAPLLAVAIQERAVCENPDAGPQGAGFSADGCSYTLEARNKVQAVAYRTAGDGAVYEEGDATAPLTTGADQSAQIIAQAWAVPRLTPVECERLQGFPDGYTDVPYRRRNWTPDGPRYKALGNSMAVNCMEWIGERIAEVEAI